MGGDGEILFYKKSNAVLVEDQFTNIVLGYESH